MSTKPWAAFPIIAVLLLLGACAGGDLKPIQVVSITGPVEPYIPGGPNIEIVIKNVSEETIVALSADLDLADRPQAWHVSFDVSDASPLPRGQQRSGTFTLIGPGTFRPGVPYRMDFGGTFEGGRPFNYTINVKIRSPSGGWQ